MASTEQWVQQIKYAIFDEVHCIGDTQAGIKWEHLLTLLQAPFVALVCLICTLKRVVWYFEEGGVVL